MSRAFLQHFERELKGHAKTGEAAVQQYLLDARTQPRQVYPQLVRALYRTSPKIESLLRKNGRRSFRDLWWRFSKTNTSLVDEITFAIEWFRDIIPLINQFRSFARNVEKKILSGNFDGALSEVREHRKKIGWTVWGLEAELAVITELDGSGEAKRYLAGLMESSTPRFASLIAAIFSDRYDEAISIGAFIGKCDRSFVDIRIAPQLQEYLYYRSYGYIRDYETSAPAILAISSVNSFIDHYEALVDILAAVVFDYSHTQYIPLVQETCANLVKMGVDDFRINKLLWISGGEYSISPSTDSCSELGNVLSRVYYDYGVQKSEFDCSEFMGELVKYISVANVNIAPVQPEIDTLFSKGLRYRSFCFGISIAGFASSSTQFSENFISSPWGSFNSTSVCIGDVLSLELSLSLRLITEFSRCKSSVEFQNRAVMLITAMDSPTKETLEILSDVELLWLARQLLRLQSPSNSQKVLEVILTRTSIQKQKKIAMQALLSIGLAEIPEAAEMMADALIENVGYRRELPLTLFFKSTKWADLKDSNIVAVGIVAHHANLLLDDQDTRYIARMACRSFYKTRPIADEMELYYISLEKLQRARFVEFLKEVWVEDNLAMAGFQSTQEVREDRIHVLQTLLLIDDKNASRYRDEIRDLTFEQNLWKGLKHINETRIFVNEAAIARWAEKELVAEFNRWQKLRTQDQSATPLVDDIVLKYLLPDTVEGLFAQYPKVGLTEADAVLMNLIERLLARFLIDPTDGLNCYLSSRIRHGTLKGTLLGPLEEAGLIGQSDIALRNEPAIKTISSELISEAISSIREFEKSLVGIVERLVKKEVQIRGLSAPSGRIYAYLSPENGLAPVVSLAENLHFPVFVPACFELFWSVLGYSLGELRHYVRNEVKMEIQSSFDKLIEEFNGRDESVVGLVSTLRSVATATQAQCDLVSEWFSPNRSLQNQDFSLREAIEIARKTTKNVYRGFPDEISVTDDLSLDTPLTPLGLSAITDCLYVLFENAWKHSGLASELGYVSVQSELDGGASIIKLTVSHSLSDKRLLELKNGTLEEIRDFYIVNADMRMAASEGGSGLAKIVRFTRDVDRASYPEPVAISLTEKDQVAVTVHLPLFERGGAYDAYFE